MLDYGNFPQVVRNVVFEPRLLPGGGATEMAVSQALTKKAQVGLSWLKKSISASPCAAI